MHINKIEVNWDCGIYIASKVFGGKWKCCILDAIHRGIARPADISRYIPDASKRLVEMQLAELLSYGVIEKQVEDTFPKKTEYHLTEIGKSILPILRMMDEWGLSYSAFYKERFSKMQN
jgi:DNA-binding HxlR family transcriptional regulator